MAIDLSRLREQLADLDTDTLAEMLEGLQHDLDVAKQGVEVMEAELFARFSDAGGTEMAGDRYTITRTRRSVRRVTDFRALQRAIAQNIITDREANQCWENRATVLRTPLNALVRRKGKALAALVEEETTESGGGFRYTAATTTSRSSS